MKAVILKDNACLAYEEVIKPTVVPGSVCIRISACGICGSDIPRVFNHAARNYPIVLGHEFSGVIEEIGECVTGLEIGDHVVAAPLIPCHACEDCKQGNYALCSNYSFIGSRQQGAMADYIVVPAKNVVKVSKDIPFECAATIEPSTVALHALRQIKFEPGRDLVVIGCGIIGLYVVQWAKILGASSVTAIGRGSKGLEAAKELGADRCFSTLDYTDNELLKVINSDTCHYVIESSGATQTIHLAFKIVAKKGAICLIGTPKKELTFSVQLWEQINRKECWLTGSWMSYSAPFPGEEWSTSAEYMKRGDLKIVPGMIHGVFPMKEASKVFEIARDSANGRCVLINEGVTE